MFRKLKRLSMESLHLVWYARRIRKRKQSALPNNLLCREYLRVGWRTICTRLLSRDAGQIKIFGYVLNYLHHDALALSFDEIFIRQDYYFTTPSKRPFIIDCGSNIGMAITYFKTIFPEASIVGFEPFPEAFSALERNITENGLRDVEVHNLALTGSGGSATLFYDPAKLGSLRMSLNEDRIKGASIKIETTTLSKFIQRKVDFLKLDIEGSELEVLLELEQADKLGLITEMAIEYHHHINKKIDDFSQLLMVLERNGFGYHIGTNFNKDCAIRVQFQDIMVYAYAKSSSSTAISN